MGVLDGFTFHQLVSAPRRREGDNPEWPDPSAAALFAALIGAHAELGCDSTPGAAIAVAWLRAPGAQRLRFLVGGKPHLPAAAGGDGAILYPPGARGVP